MAEEKEKKRTGSIGKKFFENFLKDSPPLNPDEEESPLKALKEICKQIIADMNSLLKLVGQNEHGSAFMETARRAATVTGHLEDTIRRLANSDWPPNSPEGLLIHQMDEKAQTVKSGMVVLIKATKNVDTMTGDNFEETVRKCVQDLTNSVKFVSTTAQNMQQKQSKDKDSFGKQKSKQLMKKFNDLTNKFSGSSTNLHGPLTPRGDSPIFPKSKDDSLIPTYPSLRDATPIEISHEIIHVILSLQDLISKYKFTAEPSLVSQFGNLVSKEKLLAKKLISLAQKSSLQIEEQYLSRLHETFQEQVRSAFFDKSDSVDLKIFNEAKIRYTEGLWWFTRLLYPCSFEIKDITTSPTKTKHTRSGFHSLENVVNSTAPPTTPPNPTLDKTNRVLISLCLPLNDVVKTVVLEEEDSLQTFCEKNFEKFYSTRLPHMSGDRFCLKVPGAATYLKSPKQILSQNLFIKEMLQKKEKIELIFVEKIGQAATTSISDAVKNAEESVQNQAYKGTFIPYKGEVKEMITQFATNCQTHLSTLTQHYKIDPEKLKEMLTNDKFSRNKEVLLNTMPLALRECFGRCDQIIDQTFDQYLGLRQIGDFRGIQDCGSTIMKEVTAINQQLRKSTVAIQVIVFEALLHDNQEDEDLSVFHKVSVSTLSEYYSLKVGLLEKLKYQSSLRLPADNEPNLNAFYAKKLMNDVLDIAYQYMRLNRKLFDDKQTEIATNLIEEAQKKAFARFWGPVAFDMLIEKNLASFMPWVDSWIESAVPSIFQREVFGKTKEEIQELLEQNNNQMIKGFNMALESKLIDPIVRLEELFQGLSDEVELLSFSYGIQRKFSH